MSSTQTETLSGVVSAQAALGETVTVAITKPDSSIDTVTGITDASGNYTITYQATSNGGYSAVATIAADASFTAATSATATFTVSGLLQSRTITLTASP